MTTYEDIIPDGHSINFVCKNSSLLVPEEFDEDLNFAIDIICSNGTYTLSENWPPTECIEEASCSNFPEPPPHTHLERIDKKKKMRLNDFAYFVCERADMIIQPSGNNMFSPSCHESMTSNIVWPNCTVDPICSHLPTPSNDSLLVRSNTDVMVKIGEYVKYECRDRDKFFATPNVSIF